MRVNSHRTSTTANDLIMLDKIIASLLGAQPRDSPILNRLKSKSFKSRRGSILSNTSSIVLPTIMEGNACNRESAGSTGRPNSWSEKVFNHPIVSNVLNNIKGPENNARDPLIENVKHDHFNQP